MAWTLQLADTDGNILSESFATLDEELVEYLARLEGFPILQSLRGLEPSEETWIDEEARDALEEELAELAPLVRLRKVPEPPTWVGLEDTGDIRLGEEMGWRGLLDFLQRVQHLIHLSKTMGMDLWALPDE